MKKIVACEDGASFHGTGIVEKEFSCAALITATVLHRGLIPGYPAAEAAFVARRD